MEHAKQAAELAAEDVKTKEAFEQFMSAYDSLGELDLTDIEPLMPPTYKASRYNAK